MSSALDALDPNLTYRVNPDSLKIHDLSPPRACVGRTDAAFLGTARTREQIRVAYSGKLGKLTRCKRCSSRKQ